MHNNYGWNMSVITEPEFIQTSIKKVVSIFPYLLFNLIYV